MNAIRQAIASALIKLGKWIQPQLQAGPIGEDPK
jgi:ribosomal protein S9